MGFSHLSLLTVERLLAVANEGITMAFEQVCSFFSKLYSSQQDSSRSMLSKWGLALSRTLLVRWLKHEQL